MPIDANIIAYPKRLVEPALVVVSSNRVPWMQLLDLPTETLERVFLSLHRAL